MGTPDFAVASLRALVTSGLNVVAVITAPDRPKGRGQVLTPSPVKSFALQRGIDVLQPKNLKAESFLEELRTYEANLQIVVAFRMLPEVVWAMPAYGTFNLHASLLPKYRGAAPINWALINGETETGVTTFFLQHEIDTGEIILQKKVPIEPDDTAGTLHDKLMETGADLVVETAQQIQNNTVTTSPQDSFVSGATPEAPKLFKETCRLQWDQPALEIVNKIRGLSPYPAAWTTLGKTTYKVFSARMDTAVRLNPGEVLQTTDQVWVGAASDAVELLEVQKQGKKRMKVADLLKGNSII